MSAKQRLKLVILWTLRTLGLFALARWWTRHNAIIIGWHGVSLMGEEAAMPRYFISPQTLRRRLAHLKRYFQIVPLESFVEQHDAGRFQPRQVALTFDDAMYDWRKAAQPVLKEFDAPATVYVISSMLDAPSRADMLMLQYVLLKSPLAESPAGLPELPQRMPLRTEDERFACLAVLRKHCQQLSLEGASLSAYVDATAAAFEVEMSDQVQARVWDYMTADEVRQCAAAGYSMQPHSHLHRHTTEILDTLADDTRLCREKIEKVTGQPAVDYCYPTGMWNHEAARILTASGMRSGVTCEVGHNGAATSAMALRRYIDGESFTQLEFEFVVSGLKWLFDSLRRPSQRFETSEVEA